MKRLLCVLMVMVMVVLTVPAIAWEEDVDYICDSLPPIINKLRVMSPVWEKYSKR